MTSLRTAPLSGKTTSGTPTARRMPWNGPLRSPVMGYLKNSRNYPTSPNIRSDICFTNPRTHLPQNTPPLYPLFACYPLPSRPFMGSAQIKVDQAWRPYCGLGAASCGGMLSSSRGYATLGTLQTRYSALAGMVHSCMSTAAMGFPSLQAGGRRGSCVVWQLLGLALAVVRLLSALANLLRSMCCRSSMVRDGSGRTTRYCYFEPMHPIYNHTPILIPPREPIGREEERMGCVIGQGGAICVANVY